MSRLSALTSSAPRDDVPPIARRTWLVGILVLAFALRAFDLTYASAFEDEGLMILMGRSVLTHAPDLEVYMRWAFNWYLWPVTIALADRLGGLAGVRLLAALLGTAAVLAQYLLARRLFGARAGLAAAAIFAALAPAILTSRIATHDTMGVPLLLFACVLLARARDTGEWRAWLGAAIVAFGCFLVKHPLASAFPPLCLVALAIDRRRGLAFGALLALLVAGYAAIYWRVLVALLGFVQDFGAFRAPAVALWTIYVVDRLDLWATLALALAAALASRRDRWAIAALAVVPLPFVALHLWHRLDYHTWKHAVYPLALLTPAAAAGAVTLADHIVRREPPLVAAMLGLTALTLGMLGRHGLVPDAGGLPFVWPDTRIVRDAALDRLRPGQRILLDDAALRYELSVAVAPDHMTDPYWIEHRGAHGPAAARRAVEEGVYDVVVFDGSTGPPAAALHAAVDPVLSLRYARRFAVLQPSTGALAAVWERVDPPAARPPDGPRVAIETPASGTTAPGPTTDVAGTVMHVPEGARLEVAVRTDRWYVQGPPTSLPAGTSRFRRSARLGGTGADRCSHAVRARLLDASGRLLDESIVSGVRRASPDSVAIPCQAVP